MRTRTLAQTILLVAALAHPVFAQAPQPPATTSASAASVLPTASSAACASYARNIGAVAAAASSDEARTPALALVDVGQSGRCFIEFAVRSLTFADIVRRFESTRTDRQAGASSPSSGSTTVVAAAPVAKVLSFAAETGAITQSVTKNVVTVRGNLGGIPSALVGNGIIPYCVTGDKTHPCIDHSLLGGLRKVSFGISFDPGRGQTLTATPATAATPGVAAAIPTTVSFTASKQEVAAYNVRVDLWNRRDAASPGFTKKWTDRLKKAPGDAALNKGVDELAAAGTFLDDVTKLAGYDAWRRRSAEAIVTARGDRERIARVHARALNELLAIVQTMPKWAEQVEALRRAYNRFFLAQDQLIDAIAETNVLALEFTRDRPVNQPSTSNVRVIFDYAIDAQTRVVANGALTLYDGSTADKPGVGRVRDVQVALQVNHDLGKLAVLGPASVGVAGYYQRQQSPAILTVDPAKPLPGVTFAGLPAGAKEVFAKTGDIYLAQARLVVTPSGSSVTVPLSVTYSNRTELIDKPTFRGQVGISYNFDALFAGLKH